MNTIKTWILLASLTALFMTIGGVLGGENGLLLALIFSIVMNIGSYWFSDKLVLRLYGAKEIKRGNLYTLTKKLAKRAKIPTPKLYIIENNQANAFATGRNPQNASVAINTGLINMLSETEISGVIAHELAHIRNRDTLVMTITATLAGAITSLINFSMFFGISATSEDNDRGNIFLTLIIAFLAPFAAMLVQMAISRTREYSADRVGALICKNPLALASALEKIEQSVHQNTQKINQGTAHLFIINPLHNNKMDNLFSTHPNTKNRILKLKQLDKMIKKKTKKTI